MFNVNSHIYIWDSPKKISLNNEENGTLFLWQTFDNNHNEISIPNLVEENSDYLRSKYLEWIYKIGNTKVGSKSFIEILKVRDNFSAWWMSLITEKSNFAKSNYIDEVIRLICLDKIIKENSISKLKIYSSNQRLINILRKYCSKNKIIFNSEKLKTHKKFTKNNFFKSIFYSLPYSQRALIWFIYKLIYTLPLKGTGINNWKKINRKFIFISYLFNMKGSDCNKFLNSSYWGNLPNRLVKDKKKTTWIHIFVKDKIIKNPTEASILINRLNRNNNEQNHLTLFSFININVIVNVLLDWVKLNFSLRKIDFDKNFPSLEDFDMREYYKNDFIDSFVGNTSIDNLLMLNLFEEAFSKIDKNTTLTYLLENQGWEMSMLGVCKVKKFQKVIGFSHASTRYWDLRNFFDKREYSNKKNLKLPLPDYLALNSINAFQAFLKMGYPSKRIINVESLRHLYLNNMKINKRKIIKKNQITILILGDYLKKNTYYQLDLLNNLPSSLIQKINFIYKSHPACDIDINIFKKLNIKEINKEIFESLPEADIAYCSSSTSACIDSYSYGLPVIIPLDPKSLNISPLKDFKSVSFIKNTNDLINAIIKFSSQNKYSVKQRCIFNLSTNLKDWRNLLYENNSFS